MTRTARGRTRMLLYRGHPGTLVSDLRRVARPADIQGGPALVDESVSILDHIRDVSAASQCVDLHACCRRSSVRKPPVDSASDLSASMSRHLQASNICLPFLDSSGRPSGVPSNNCWPTSVAFSLLVVSSGSMSFPAPPPLGSEQVFCPSSSPTV